MLDLYDELAAVIGALNASAIEYALCGGLAMAVWDVPRATVDIDLLIAPESYEDVARVVEPLGFILEARPMTFASGAIDIRRISKPDPAGGDVLMLDLLLVTPAIKDVWQSRERVAWEDGMLSVVSRDGLIKLKSLRGSGRDVDDIARLRGEAVE